MPTATLGQAFRKVRTVTNGAAKLEAAVTSLRELEGKHQEIEKFYLAAFALATAAVDQGAAAEGAYRKAIADRDLAAVKNALNAVLSVRAQLDYARAEAATFNSTRQTGIGFAIFLQENPSALKVFSTVAEGRLKQAEATAAAVLASEKSLLPSWDLEDIERSPKIRAANAVVRELQGLLQRIQAVGGVNSSVWTSYVDQLLE
jgi:hypothetical protein